MKLKKQRSQKKLDSMEQKEVICAFFGLKFSDVLKCWTTHCLKC